MEICFQPTLFVLNILVFVVCLALKTVGCKHVFHHASQSFLFVFQMPFREENSYNDAMLFLGKYFFIGKISWLHIYLSCMIVIFAAALLMSHCNFSSMILSSIVMITFFTSSNRYFHKCSELSDRRVISMAISEYFFSVYFLYRSIKSLKFISDKLSIANR